MSADDQLTRWIDELRTRLDAGDLDGLAPFDLGDGTGRLPGAQTIRIMLHDFDDVTAQLTEPHLPISTALRRRLLLNQFQQLRDLVGAHHVLNGVRHH